MKLFISISLVFCLFKLIFLIEYYYLQGKKWLTDNYVQTKCKVWYLLYIVDLYIIVT